MTDYKLTVVKTSQGNYQVSHYYKARPVEAKWLPEVIDYMVRLDALTLENQPSYINVGEMDRKILESIREGIIRRESKMILKTKLIRDLTRLLSRLPDIRSAEEILGDLRSR